MDEYDIAQWQARWSLNMVGFGRIKHLVCNRLLQRAVNWSCPGPRPVSPSPATVNTVARFEASQFDSCNIRDCVVNGIRRCLPLGVFRAFQDLALTHNLTFPINRLFRQPLRLTARSRSQMLASCRWSFNFPPCELKVRYEYFVVKHVATRPCDLVCTRNIYARIHSCIYFAPLRNTV